MEDDGVFVVDSTSNKSDNDLKLELPLSLDGVPSLDGSIKVEDKDSSLLFFTSSSEKGLKLDRSKSVMDLPSKVGFEN